MVRLIRRYGCEVVDPVEGICDFPPALEDPDGSERLLKCYRCGLDVCASCSALSVASTITGRRRIRMCRSCREDEDRF